MENVDFGGITQKILENIDTLAIILYGSFSRNTQNAESDIDIAVISESTDKTVLFELKKSIEELTSRDIDLVNLENIDISESLRYEVLMNGVLLYCKDNFKFDIYKIEKLKEFLDFNESRYDIIERVKSGGKIYGK